MISSSLGKLLKQKKKDVVVSGICPCRDRFNQKANDVNQLLAGKGGENGFDYISHNNINTRLHLNRDGLHLNKKGIHQISCNFKDYFHNGLKFGRNLQNFDLTDNLITEDLNRSNHLGKSLSHSENNSTSCISFISSIRKQYPKNIIMGNLNINSLQNKFELIKEVFFNNIDVFFLSETKLDETFPNIQFQIEGYKNFRLYGTCYWGGVCMYVNEDIAARCVKYNCLSNIESICLE